MAAQSIVTKRVTPSIEDLQGLWRRSLLAWPNGELDETTRVRWLQGRCAYIDLRQPASLPAFARKRGLADLSMEDCAVLARQEGFAGRFTFDGQHFEWARSIDFQPEPLYSDAGSLWWEGDVLIERGRDVEYIEHWRRDETITITNVAAVTLRGTNCGTKASLLRVGSLFMFARDRAIVPPAHRTLPECIREVSSLQNARSLIDCEISFGQVNAESFRISVSSLPYRVGDLLKPVDSFSCLTLCDRTPSGSLVTRHWDVVETEGDMRFLCQR